MVLADAENDLFLGEGQCGLYFMVQWFFNIRREKAGQLTFRLSSSASCVVIIINREFNYLRMNYRFEKIAIIHWMNFR